MIVFATINGCVVETDSSHSFVDGNKRTGFVLGVLLLELNGYRFTATEEDSAHAVLALASGKLDETGYSAFLCDNAYEER